MKISVFRKVVIDYKIAPIMGLALFFFSCTKNELLDESSTTQLNNQIEQSSISGSTTSQVANAINVKNLLSVSGEEIFESIFYLKGEFVEQVPLLKNMRDQIFTEGYLRFDGAPSASQMIATRDSLSNIVVAEIKKNSPLFFTSFEAKMKSGNYFLMQKAIDEAYNQSQLANATLGFYGNEAVEYINENPDLLDGIDISNGIDDASLSQIIDNADIPGIIDNPGDKICFAAVVVLAVIALVAATYAAVAVETLAWIHSTAWFFDNIAPDNGQTEALIKQINNAF